MKQEVMIPYFTKGKQKFIAVVNENTIKNSEEYTTKDEYVICVAQRKDGSKSKFFKTIGENDYYLIQIKKKQVMSCNGIFILKKDNRILFLNLEKEMPDVSELSIFTIELQLYFRNTSLWVKFCNFFKNLFVAQKLQKS